MSRPCPRLLLTALRGGAGKTTLTLGLLAAWRAQGRRVIPFKKGPDYIDPAWHALAAGSPSHNLDPYLMEGDQILALVQRQAQAADLLLIEGNRGLFDGLDVQGTYSTAELAKLLMAPVVMVLDCTMSTRTVAALVLGCQHFDPQVKLVGVILNQVARPRHEAILRASIEQYCGIPVLGAVPRLKCAVFPERHMGLVPPPEHRAARQALKAAQDLAERYLDLPGLWAVACKAPPLPEGSRPLFPGPEILGPVTLGIIRDSAFQFYYPENLEALEKAGARLVFLSALSDSALPPHLDGLYIGGGFPETNAPALAGNSSFRHSLRQAAENGLPIYAECGGLMYLGRTLYTVDGQAFPMVGLLPYDFHMSKSPQGHGYTTLEVVAPNPFFALGTRLKGHEFHYSRIQPEPGPNAVMAFSLGRGTGVGNQRDGFVYKRTLAAFTHLHALGTPEWALGLVRQAWEYQRQRLASLNREILPKEAAPGGETRKVPRGMNFS
jgi:cobyrinic acid a,c-diamide synthase|uniref:Cobyrinate a,c-diamide synthase n=1 Tax=Desulfobacca acetoxidans TaxID=60893 RepID=A0A7C5ALP0_9BACT